MSTFEYQMPQPTDPSAQSSAVDSTPPALAPDTAPAPVDQAPTAEAPSTTWVAPPATAPTTPAPSATFHVGDLVRYSYDDPHDGHQVLAAIVVADEKDSHVQVAWLSGMSGPLAVDALEKI